MKKLENIRLFRFLLYSDSAAKLIGKCVVMLLIPYAYLFLCGLVFDALLGWYFMTTFIFVTLIIFYLVMITITALAVSRYIRRQKDAKA